VDLSTSYILGRNKPYKRAGISVNQEEELLMTAVDLQVGWARVRNAAGAAGWLPITSLVA